ncbi:MAG: amidohydrolase family protein [Proteobacteria bacterium]|nr:amidohydrolase family protein [Pseudomonadota bacterium]MCP4920137.1 amidohydrolase family protein [Pseudomonadota bacterium]
MTLLLALACNGPTTDHIPPTDSGGDSDDTGDGPSEDLVTVGPDLPECTPIEVDSDLVALSGVLLLESGPEAGVVLYDRSDGLIDCVGACDTASASIVCTEGVISAGLVNAHDHMQYNSLPPWDVEPRFEDRYDWRSDGEYWDYRTAYDVIDGSYSCEIMRFSEMRGLIGGSTAVVGSYGNDCIQGGMRNLDEGFGEHGLSGYDMSYSAGTVTNMDEGDAAYDAEDLADGTLECVMEHVAEGKNGSVRNEAEHMLSIGAAGSGFAWVHATDADAELLAGMAMTGTSMVWSPRSNLALYAETSRAALARKLGVTVAVGPDWTPSGSSTPREEIACVDAFLTATGTPISDRVAHSLVTSVAADVVGAGDRLGSLAEGHEADIAVFDWSDTPYRAVIDGSPDQVRLVLVAGDALFGHTELVEPLSSIADWCDTLDVCGASRSACVARSGSDDSLASIEAALQGAMDAVQMPEQDLEYASQLLPLFACERDLDVCDPTFPVTGDADGDEVGDETDLCPDVYDPLQEDIDDDGVGDFCDPCPLVPDSAECRHAPEDIDDDNVLTDDDNCPVLHNPAQEDTDDDGLGDVCDACPETANPNGGACPSTVAVLQDEDHADHPAENTPVSLSGLIVTGVNDDAGYFAQDPTLSEHAGIYVYAGSNPGVAVGDEVSVSGNYVEYHDLAEISSPTTSVTGTGTIEPLEVSACDVATGGPDAERYESMLITVVDVTVSNANPDDPDDYGTFEVEDCLWVDDSLSDAHTVHPDVGTEYGRITGPMNWSYDQRRILPRSASDVE